MRSYILIILILNISIFSGGFDDGISIREKIEIRHMAKTHKNGVVGDTLYVYEADKREKIKDKEGALKINSVYTDSKTLKKNRKLNVTQIQENIKIKRVSGKTKNRKILKFKREKKGVSIGAVDIRGKDIKNVKTYRRNNQYIVE